MFLKMLVYVCVLLIYLYLVISYEVSFCSESLTVQIGNNDDRNNRFFFFLYDHG